MTADCNLSVVGGAIRVIYWGKRERGCGWANLPPSVALRRVDGKNQCVLDDILFGFYRCPLGVLIGFPEYGILVKFDHIFF